MIRTIIDHGEAPEDITKALREALISWRPRSSAARRSWSLGPFVRAQGQVHAENDDGHADQ